MRMKQMWMGLPLMTLLFYACNDGLDEQVLESKTKKVSFTSTISVKQQTRAIDASWEANDKIGLYMLQSSNKEVVGSNVCYVTTRGDGNFEAASTPLYYPKDGSDVDFLAYYPYSSTSTSTYPVNVTNQSSPKDIDLLYSNNLTARNSSSMKGNLQFYHQLSRLTIHFSTADNSNIKAIAATIKGVPTKADFDLETGKLAVDSKSVSAVPMFHSAATAQAILIPTPDVKGVKVSLVLEGATQEFALPSSITSLEAGTNYTFTVNVKNGASVVVPDDSNATTWRETPVLDKAMLEKKNIHYISHFMPNDSKVRNYSMLYDSDLNISHWVAYPYCSYYGGNTKRTDDWGFDPLIDPSLQVDLFRSYGSGYARGHQLPSADRLRDKECNKTTFYFTNMAPQIQNGLNGGIWMYLESQVRDWSQDTDTIFVVTGASAKANVNDKDIQYITKGNKRVAVPKFFYKALARRVNGQFRTIGFKMEQKAYSHNDYMKCAVPVSELEELTGFTFFPSIDVAIKKELNTEYWKN